MQESLLTKLTEYFPKRRKSCIKNVLILSLSILLKETVNLHKLKNVVGLVIDKASTKSASHYKRLIRIFDVYALTPLWIELLGFVFQLLRLKVDYLILDGTSWKHGDKWYHYMTLCMVYQGVAIPIYWQDIDKRGHSHTDERIDLLKQALSHYQLAGKTLLADREYIGTTWFKYLHSKGIRFVIRVKKGHYQSWVNQAGGKRYSKMYRQVLRSRIENKTIGQSFSLHGISLRLIMFKNPKNDPKDPVIILISSWQTSPKRIAQAYKIRWKIETCFKHLKSNGFELEQMNLRTPERARLLMAITVFTYVISIHEGLKEYEHIPSKNYAGGQTTKAISVFRNGMNRLIQYIHSWSTFAHYILEQINAAIKKKIRPKSVFV